MHTSNWAYTVLISLNLVRWLSLAALVFAFVQLLRGKLQFQSIALWLWVLIPAVAITLSTNIETKSKASLLKERLSQSWSWTLNDSLHTLTLNTKQQTFLHSVQPIKTTTQNTKTGKPSAISGILSPFKQQVETDSQEIYYAVYLFDFPKAGQTTMVSICGLDSPKIHLGENAILELR